MNFKLFCFRIVNMIGKIKNLYLKNKVVLNNIFLTLLIKGGALLISILIVPAYLSYFSNDTAYGAWVTISSVFTWITLFDFGIGNGLRNKLCKSFTDKDEKESKSLISSSYLFIGLISLLLLLCGLTVIWLINWNTFLKVDSSIVSPETFKFFVSVMYFGVIAHFFLLLICSICYALQQAFVPGLLSLLTQVIILIFLFLPINGNLNTKIIILSAIYFFAYNIPLVIESIILFGTKLKGVRPSLKYFDFETAKSVMKLGGLFFVIQLALIALNSTNEIYINLFFKPEDVTTYQLYHKLFYIITVFISLISQPVWSAITKAMHEKRFLWIKKVNNLTFVLGIASLIVSFLLVLIYQPIVDIWLGKGRLNAETNILISFAIHTGMMGFTTLISTVSNGIGKLKWQAISVGAGAILKLLFVFIFTTLFSCNWSIVIVSNIIAMIPIVIMLPINTKIEIQKLEEGATKNE